MRQVADLHVLPVEEIRLFQQVMRLLVHVAVRRQEAPHHEFGPAQPLDRQHHVVEHRQARKQAGDLERARHSERGAPLARPARHVLAEQHDLPGAGRQDAGDDVEERRLARPVRTDDRLAIARADLQADAAHGVETAEALAQALELEHGLSALSGVRFHARSLG